MKCPKCGGKGTYKVRKRDEAISCLIYMEDVKCDNCHGTGQIEQTNEEWLKSLDTEGLVDYLFEVHKGGNSVERQMWIEKHKERVKMQFRGWLKEKHNG